MYVEPIHKYRCVGCDSTLHVDDCIYDEYLGGFICAHCGEDTIEIESSREAEWFSVALYETESVYGGPEEGGWYYRHGTLVPRTVRTFTNSLEGREEAERYVDALYATQYHSDRWSDTKYTDRVFSERLPDTHFPKHKPVWS